MTGPEVAAAFGAGCYVVMWISLGGIAQSHYMLRRGEWLFRRRSEILSRSVDEYIALPGYHYMLYKRWWVWKFEEFYPGGKHNPHAPLYEFGSNR